MPERWLAPTIFLLFLVALSFKIQPIILPNSGLAASKLARISQCFLRRGPQEQMAMHQMPPPCHPKESPGWWTLARGRHHPPKPPRWLSSNSRGMEATREDPGEPTSCCTIGGGANSPTQLLYLGHNQHHQSHLPYGVIVPICNWHNRL
jgi:hypothetical protein